jgi:hypothetical protein
MVTVNVRAYAQVVENKRSKKPYHRRSGVIWRPGQLGVPREPRTGWLWQSVWMNDGGEDAPLSERGRAIFRGAVLLIIAVGLVLILVSR